MEFKEFVPIMKYLVTNYPTMKLETTDPQALLVWYDRVKNLGRNEFYGYVKHFCDTHTYPPVSAREIVEPKCEEIKSTLDSAEKAFMDTIDMLNGSLVDKTNHEYPWTAFDSAKYRARAEEAICGKPARKIAFEATKGDFMTAQLLTRTDEWKQKEFPKWQKAYEQATQSVVNEIFTAWLQTPHAAEIGKGSEEKLLK